MGNRTYRRLFKQFLAIYMVLQFNVRAQAAIISCSGVFSDQVATEKYTFENIVAISRYQWEVQPPRRLFPSESPTDKAWRENINKVWWGKAFEETIEVTHWKLDKFDQTPPETNKSIEIEISGPLRQRREFGLSTSTVKVPLISLGKDYRRVPVNEESYTELFLAETSIGQVVLITAPLEISQKGNPIVSHIAYSQVKMAEVGAIEFAMIGKRQDGEFVFVLPLHHPFKHLADVSIDTADAHRIFDQLDVLKEADIPFLQQILDPHIAKDQLYYLSRKVAGDISGGSGYPTRIMGFHSAGREPWQISGEVTDFSHTATRSSSNNPLSVLNILKADTFRKLEFRKQKQFVLERIEKGNFTELFSMMYIDIIIPQHRADHRSEFDSKQLAQIFWQDLGFRIGVDKKSGMDTIGWKNNRSLKYHFKKHGNKLMADTKEDYGQMAREFFTDDSGTAILVERPDGAFFKYDFGTLEFAVATPNREVITYFKLNGEYRSSNEFETYIIEQFDPN